MDFDWPFFFVDILDDFVLHFKHKWPGRRIMMTTARNEGPHEVIESMVLGAHFDQIMT